ncbi:MAG TPA: alpha-amylase family glycosyl hydrolase, partial [Streptosporangiaceae bacterium]|nr:alpha-amylase family glycosyl hydrolase [Streptosporangiaceae bacterium]
MEARVELIAYADRFGGDLAGLRALLNGPLAGLFGGVHVLPFYRPYDGTDAGFDPQDHTEVDARLGSWDDIAELAAQYRVMADMIINHVSSSSPQFRDWLAHGPASPFAGMFLTFGSAFPAGATEDMLTRLYRPRPGLPFTPYVLADGTKRLLWTTFTAAQVDVDVRHPVTRDYLVAVLDKFAAARVSRVRLDAVGYAVKTPGLSSFMTPETFTFIGEVTAWCRQRGLEVLVEVHSHYLRQVEIARQVDYVYDFALPPLVLHALTAADAGPLLAWLKHRPGNAITVLDTHDGIGVIDVGPDAADRARP